MPYLTSCPTCRRPLRIQDEYAGRQIACPVCDTVFVAPSAPQAVEAPSEQRVAAQPENPDANEAYWIESPHASPPLDMPELRPRRRSRKRERARARLLPPAICLIVAGGLTFCFYAASGFLALVSDEFRPEVPKRGNRAAFSPQHYFGVYMCAQGTVALGGAAVVITGIHMLVLRSHSFAVTGSIVAMVPCCMGFGCLLGLPFGIWSLVILYDSEVKSAFR